jgi:hypothetical protein
MTEHKLNTIIVIFYFNQQQRLSVQMKAIKKKVAETKSAARKAREDQIIEDIKRRLKAKNTHQAPDDRAIEEIIRDEIENLADDDVIFTPKKQKTWSGRADGWEAVARYAQEHSDYRAFTDFPDYFISGNVKANKMRLKRWKDSVEKNIQYRRYRSPAYGEVIDRELLEKFNIRRNAGLEVDDVSLRLMLIEILEIHGLTQLLHENGGPHIFGSGWASRFYKRHNISI